MSSDPSGSAAASKPPFHVAIVGGGIGGLCLAIGLQKQGVSFHLYEAAHAFSEIGAGVSLNIMAQRAMDLLDERIGEGFRRQATYNAELRDTFFSYQHGMQRPDADTTTYGAIATGNRHKAVGEQFAELHGPQYGICSVHRAHFLDELIALVPKDHVSFGHRVTSIEDEGDHVLLRFRDFDEPVRADAVLGCDGVKSAVRESLLGPEFHAHFSGKYAYRGLLNMDRAAALLGDRVARNSHIHSGYGGHILHMPVEHGATLNVVAFRTKEDGEWHDDRWVLPMNQADMERDFAGWGDAVQKILSLMEKPDVWALFDHPPAPTFYKNRVVLMGDAAHATTPHQGSGAGFAIADAYVLTELLSRVQAPDQLPIAFAAYDEIRRPAGLKLVTTSRRQGLHWEFQDEQIGDDEGAFHKELQHRMDWIVNMDIKGEAQKACDIFQKGASS